MCIRRFPLSRTSRGVRFCEFALRRPRGSFAHQCACASVSRCQTDVTCLNGRKRHVLQRHLITLDCLMSSFTLFKRRALVKSEFLHLCRARRSRFLEMGIVKTSIVREKVPSAPAARVATRERRSPCPDRTGFPEKKVSPSFTRPRSFVHHQQQASGRIEKRRKH